MDGLWLIHFTGRTFKVTTTNHSSDPQTNLPYPSPTHPCVGSLRNRTGEERRRQTLCDKRDNNSV